MGVYANFRVTMEDAEPVDIYLDHDDDGVLCILRQGNDRVQVTSSEAAEEMAKCLQEIGKRLREVTRDCA